jgi:hypothetical protein
MAAQGGVGKASPRITILAQKIPTTPIFFSHNTLEALSLSDALPTLMKPKHLFHEINKIFFFARGLDSHHSGGFLSSRKKSLARALFKWFDTPASMVRIASSGDTHRPPRTSRTGFESRFGILTNADFYGWSCPQFLRRRRARREFFARLFLVPRELSASSEPTAFATQHSARSAGSRSTIARETSQCRK